MKPTALSLLLFLANFIVTRTSPDARLNSIDNNTSWQNFLSGLPVKSGPITDYKGNLVDDQRKHYQLVNYDVGNRDLQQCADFLIRLRAEYLFQNNRKNEIAFTFTSGHKYAFRQFCEGHKPVLVGGQIRFHAGPPAADDYGSLRKYLNYVYMYAGTVSLNRDLMPADDFRTGTVIITPGRPGHCMMIVDQKVTEGKRLFKLAESFMPAQTPYILKNPVNGTAWHELKKGVPINTASFYFSRYNLRRFE